MGDRKKTPDDMALFRREMGDVRPLKVKKRVPPQKPGTVKTTEPGRKKSPVDLAQDSADAQKCIRSPEKRSFETMDEALSAARYARQEWLAKVHPYLCHACGKFHLTSKQK